MAYMFLWTILCGSNALIVLIVIIIIIITKEKIVLLAAVVSDVPCQKFWWVGHEMLMYHRLTVYPNLTPSNLGTVPPLAPYVLDMYI